MPAYLIARVQVTDWDRYRQYMAKTPDILEQHEGRFIARGGEVITLEGPEETQRVILVEFPSMERARSFYDSPEYREAMKLREGAATAQFVVVEGV